MPYAIAADDIVRTHEEGAANARPPLLVLDPLLAFLDRHDLGTGDDDPVVEPIGDGHSNVTYRMTRGARTFVLRRPPRPPIPPSANDMVREARVLGALHGHARVPEILAVCDDETVLGAPFYVMEFLEGVTVTTELPAVLDDPAERRRAGEELVDALVELHAVDWRAVGLEGFGRPEGYPERQVKRFLQVWEHNKTREVPEVQRVAAWLRDHLPVHQAPSIVHGDFRMGNLLLAPAAPARVIAVLDWEMSTIGDPLADLGYLTATYSSREDPPMGLFELTPVTREEGFPLREELVARYEQRSGRTMSDIRWYQTLALWKSIVFMEGNYRRASSGLTDDPYLKSFGEGVLELAARAEALTRGT